MTQTAELVGTPVRHGRDGTEEALMGSLKKWQIALIALAPIVLGVSIYLSVTRGTVRTADSIMLVDMLTGDRFIASTSGRRGIIVPAEHPETGQRSLIPIAQNDNGEWYIAGAHLERFKGYVRNQIEIRRQLGPNASTMVPRDSIELVHEQVTKGNIVDLSTGRVRVSESSPTRLR